MEQLQIPFSDILEILQEKKQKRYKLLSWKSWFTEEQILFLLKITYDLTDKDFEYLVAYLLEKEWYTVSTFWKFHKWIDVEARRNGKLLNIQCKQFAKAYITDKYAWAFCGQINKMLKSTGENESFYYLTTSYITPDAREIFARDGVKIISNKELLEKCEKQGFFTEGGWKELIVYIRGKRVEELVRNRKVGVSNYEEIKKSLRTQRINEFKHHLPPSIRNSKSSISFFEHQSFLKPFFQYWDLV
jgi:Restriction endonuclease